MRALQAPPGPPRAAGGPITGTRDALPATILLEGTVSGSGRRMAAHAIDAVIVLTVGIVIGAIAWIAGWPTWTTVLVIVAALIITPGLLLAQHTRTGQTPGLGWRGLRVVDRATALPPRLGRRAPGGTLVADLRAGRDPLRLRPTLGSPTAAVTETGRWHDLGESPRHLARLTIDDGTTFSITGPTVIGRDPVPPAGSAWEVHAVPDLTRTVSKNHALLEPDAEGVWVTDLGSTNGTTVLSRDGRRQPVARGARTQAPPGGRVAVGSRLVLVTSGTEEPR